MRQTIIKYALGLCVAVATSCSVDVPPPDLYSDPDAITTVEAARSLLTSCYLTYPHYEYEFSIIGNDFCLTSLSGKDVEQQNLYNWQDLAISKLASEVWLAYYNTIANCDVLLERLPQVADTGDGEKELIAAETKTLKAMSYLQLLRVFAPPYAQGAEADGVILKSQVGLEFPARATLAVCADYIRRLLTEAAAVSHATTQNGWLSQTAAQYLLAELELYCGNYAEAARYATLVLEEAPADVMAARNYGRLWDVASYEGRIFAFNTATSYYAAVEFDAAEGDYFALNSALCLHQDDARKGLNEYPMVMGGEERVLLGKYNRRNKLGQTISYINQFRYAGALFIAAEALARSGREGEARQLLNSYLTEMGARAAIAGGSGTALVEAVLLEKAKEFVGEGITWFDLKRTGASLPRLSRWGASVAATIAPTDYRWTFPIPSSEYKYNENVTQNEGWPLNR